MATFIQTCIVFPEDENVDLTDDLGGQFTEILIKKQDNVSLLLSMLEVG